MRKKRLLWSALVIGGLAAVACLGICYTPLRMLVHLWLFQNAGTFDRSRFEDIVAEVRRQEFQPGVERSFRLDDLNDPTSLRPVKPGEVFHNGQGDVDAVVTAAGKLRVTIETRDMGHAGEFGFAYSDDEPLLTPLGEDWFALDLPGSLNMVQPRYKIDDNWWRVENNLN